MGDLLGSPRVAPLSFASEFFCWAYRLRRSSTLALYAPLSFSSHFFCWACRLRRSNTLALNLSGVEVHRRIRILCKDLTRLCSLGLA